MFKIIINAFQMDIHLFQNNCICILMKYYFNV